MDNTKYYYQFNSKARGPISADKIKALLDSGLITMDTMVAKEGDQQWTPLNQADIIYSPKQAEETTPAEEVKKKNPVSMQRLIYASMVLIACLILISGINTWLHWQHNVVLTKTVKPQQLEYDKKFISLIHEYTGKGSFVDRNKDSDWIKGGWEPIMIINKDGMGFDCLMRRPKPAQ